MPESHDAMEQLHNWERKLLIVAFGAWAAVVGVYGQSAVNRIDKVVDAMERDRKESAFDRTVIERRLTAMEQRQSYILEQIKELHESQNHKAKDSR